MNIVMKNDIPEQGGVIKFVIESVWRISICLLRKIWRNIIIPCVGSNRFLHDYVLLKL